MIIKMTPVGDYDRRIVILSKERGKVAAFARGARRSNSPFTASAQPFTYGRFSLYEGRDSYRLQEMHAEEFFDTVKRDFDAIAYGSYFCEVVDTFTRENIDCEEYLKLLYVTLKALEKKLVPYPLIRRIFELRALALDGEAMQVFACARCGNKGSKYVLIPKEGGLVCTDNCASELYDRALFGDTVYALQFIMSAELGKLYSFKLQENVQEELDWVTEEFWNTYVDEEFRSLSFLNTLTI